MPAVSPNDPYWEQQVTYSPGSPYYHAPTAPGSATVTSTGTQPGAGAYGAVPTVPNPLTTASQSILGNIGNLASLYGLTTGTAGASAAGANQQYLQNLPGYAGLTSAASQNIASDLAGHISPDVVNQLSQLAAERGVGFGGGSPNANAALMAALGKTSMGLQQQGQQELTAAIGRTPVGPAFNPASFLVSPEQQQQAGMAANLYASAPNPTMAAQAAEAAANRGINTGLGLGRPQTSGINPGPLPSSWAGDRLAAGDYAAMNRYGGSVNTSLAGVPVDDWYTRTFGTSNPQFASAGPGTSNIDATMQDISEALGWDIGGGTPPASDMGGYYDTGTDWTSSDPFGDLLGG